MAVGVALDDCTLDNGCLLVVPGSHKGHTLSELQDGVFVGAITPCREQVDLSTAIPLQLNASGVSIHHVGTLHASAPNHSARPRRLLLYQCAAVDAWPLAGVKDLDDFNQNILRGEPTLEYRMTSKNVRTPRPQADKMGSIYEYHIQVKERMFAGR